MRSCLLTVIKAKLAERDTEVLELNEQVRAQNEEVSLETTHIIQALCFLLAKIRVIFVQPLVCCLRHGKRLSFFALFFIGCFILFLFRCLD